MRRTAAGGPAAELDPARLVEADPSPEEIIPIAVNFGVNLKRRRRGALLLLVGTDRTGRWARASPSDG